MSKTSEQRLIAEMQKQGFMFQHATPSQRYTNTFTHNRKTKKSTITPAIRFYVIVPLDHALGKAMNDAAKAKLRKTTVRK